MSSFHKGKIAYTMQIINVLPLLLLGFIIMGLASHYFTRTMYTEIETELKNVALNVNTMLDVAYPGNYELVGETAYRLYKGEHDLTGDYALIDKIKSDTGMDVTLFYQDTRILTTIFTAKGERFIGSAAPDVVIEEVLGKDRAQFYTNTIISGYPYFSYYMPLHNKDGSIVGILFVGKPRSEVNTAIQHSIYPLLIADGIMMLLMAVCIFFYTRRFVAVLLNIHHFLADVSNGNLSTRLPSKILQRNDELGDIGRSAITMQRSLRTMVEQDALTSLYNRRSGDAKLKQTIKEAAAQKKPFCVAIGDIDFFKKVNDTYGHECGDAVLRNVAGQLKSHIRGRGFAARWGGEEFLLVYQNMGMEEAHAALEQLVQDIRGMETPYGDSIVKVTMTFGLTMGDSQDIQLLLRNADERLYHGKANGRNQIVSQHS